MKDNLINIFPKNEKLKRKELHELLQDWEKTVASGNRNKQFSYDGFFPGYFNTFPKVLFIGREPKDQDGNDYIENTITQFEGIMKEENVLNKCNNETQYWARILCIFSIIINNGLIEGKRTFEIYESMIKKNIGFAAINISKYINNSGKSSADIESINNFLVDSNLEITDYIRKQIKILNPDIIITAHLWEEIGIDYYLDKYFGVKEQVLNNEYTEWLVDVKINNNKIKLINLYHFSSNKNDMNFYYAPISILIKYINRGNLIKLLSYTIKKINNKLKCWRNLFG